jgi:hypothetical protein
MSMFVFSSCIGNIGVIEVSAVCQMMFWTSNDWLCKLESKHFLPQSRTP